MEENFVVCVRARSKVFVKEKNVKVDENMCIDQNTRPVGVSTKLMLS